MQEILNVVESKKGHDAGRLYLIIRIEGEFAFVCDGKYRLLSKPKKKRLTHLRDTHLKFSQKKLQDLQDFEIKTFLKNISHKE
ncbi:MAG: hypothetical protein EOM55_01520 [Clostridia bacterium]|nr:hypothetical protein [Clostridia bacterium]